jgi:hypothetical protein
MSKTVLLTILFCSACIGFVGWRVHAMKERPSPQFEIVEDFSFSHADGCDSLGDLAKQVLDTTVATEQSTLTVLALGDQSTADEPRLIARYSIPIDNKVLETADDKVAKRRDILSDVQRKCEAYHRTTISPIFLGVTEAIADLRAHGCRSNSDCQLFVDTDLEENSNPAIRESIDGRRGKLNLPPPIDNAGIEITFCGLASRGRFATRSDREARRSRPPGFGESHLRLVWLRLFTSRDALQFEPYCAN